MEIEGWGRCVRHSTEMNMFEALTIWINTSEWLCLNMPETGELHNFGDAVELMLDAYPEVALLDMKPCL